MVKFKTSYVKFDRSRKEEFISSLDGVIEARLIVRDGETEVAYVEYIEDSYSLNESVVTVISLEDVVDLAKQMGKEDEVKLVDGKLFFQKRKRGGRVGFKDASWQAKRPPYRIYPE
jgi:hypothetical protein